MSYSPSWCPRQAAGVGLPCCDRRFFVFDGYTGTSFVNVRHLTPPLGPVLKAHKVILQGLAPDLLPEGEVSLSRASTAFHWVKL